jgi:hypothetical protein
LTPALDVLPLGLGKVIPNLLLTCRAEQRINLADWREKSREIGFGLVEHFRLQTRWGTVFMKAMLHEQFFFTVFFRSPLSLAPHRLNFYTCSDVPLLYF